MRHLRTAGLDLGTSGKSAISVVDGPDYNLTCLHSEAISSINPVDLEAKIEVIHNRFHPQLWVMEYNGPGAVFAAYLGQNKPTIPLATIDVGARLPEDMEIILWSEYIRISDQEFLNIRSAMYWIVRMLLRDQKLKFVEYYTEMFAQLSSLRWDHDNSHGDKIYMISKKKLKLKSNSDLYDEPFSKSPDMADSLALACLGYTMLMYQGGNEDGVEAEEGPDIIPPSIAGMFNIDEAGLEEADF